MSETTKAATTYSEDVPTETAEAWKARAEEAEGRLKEAEDLIRALAKRVRIEARAYFQRSEGK